ncbi:MAG: PorV/PorQ family protein [bacterium]
MLKKIILSFIVLISISLSTNAQVVIGKYAGEFMAIGVGGRSAAMGGAQVAIANDVTAGYWNPAGLARIDYPQFSLMHEEHFGNLVNYNYAAVAIPYGTDMSFGLSVIRLAIDGIPNTNNALIDRATKERIYDINYPNWGLDYDKITEFSNADYAFYLTFAKRHSENFSWGANVKIIQRNIDDYSATGIGFDVGATYVPMENLYLGASVIDATTTLVAWSTGRNELITPTLKVGAAYGLEFLGGTFLPALDLDIRFENRKFASYFNIGPVSFDAHTGLEYNYKNIFMIRGGYSDVKQFTVGAGIKLPKLNIDYSFAKFSGSEDANLGDSHRISLKLTLEEPKFLRNSE